jgi:carbonic anhydrase
MARVRDRGKDGVLSFCTTINCMDGRVQLPVIRYLQERLGVEYVDSITAAGPVRTLAEGTGEQVIERILRRVRISVEKHGSRHVAVVAHWDCAGNPEPEATQREQLRRAVDLVARSFPEITVKGLWVDERWIVHEA